MPRVCINCVLDDSLKRFIGNNGKPAKKCLNCGSVNELAVSSSSKRFTQLFRAVIRYHLSEWEYNTHWGGVNFYRLLSKENCIINLSDKYPYIDGLLYDLTNEAYYDYDKGISLYAGYGEGGEPNLLLKAIKDDLSPFLKVRTKELLSKNYYEIEDKLVEKLKKFRGVVDKHIDINTEYYRARIGTAGRLTPVFGDFNLHFHYKPYESSEIGAPPPPKASAGRMNREGVSCLYLATEKCTAIAEVRPHPGHHVSIGNFINNSDLCIADFSSLDLINFLTDSKLDDYLLLKSIDKLFSLPITPEKKQKYSITQALSESLRKLKYDGVAYESAVGNGVNIAIFYPEKFGYVDASGEVISIKELQYRFSNEPIVTEANKDDLVDPFNF